MRWKSCLKLLKFHPFPIDDNSAELGDSPSQSFTSNIKTSSDISIALDRFVDQLFHLLDVFVALFERPVRLENITLTYVDEGAVVAAARISNDEGFFSNFSRSQFRIAKKNIFSKSVSCIFDSPGD